MPNNWAECHPTHGDLQAVSVCGLDPLLSKYLNLTFSRQTSWRKPAKSIGEENKEPIHSLVILFALVLLEIECLFKKVMVGSSDQRFDQTGVWISGR